MKRIIIVCLILIWSAVAFGAAQEDQLTSGSVGVDEHLGQSLPGGLVFVNAEGEEVTLESLIDKPTILTLVYFECPSICTPLLQGVVEVIDQSTKEIGVDYQALSISFDPREGTELAAKKQMNFQAALKKPIPANSWRFLTGTDENIRAIADAVGFRYKRIGEDYDHPGTLIIVSAEGKIIRYIPGISFVTADVDMALAQAERGEISSTRPPAGSTGLFAFCFSYDPVKQKRVLNITTLAGLSILIGLGLVIAVALFAKKPSQSRYASEKENDSKTEDQA